MEFFNSAVTTLQTIVVGLGGALCVWGGINLLEGYQPSRTYKRNDITSFTPIRRGGMSARKQVRRNITIPP